MYIHVFSYIKIHVSELIYRSRGQFFGQDEEGFNPYPSDHYLLNPNPYSLNPYLFTGREASFLDKMKRGLSLKKIGSMEVYESEDIREEGDRGMDIDVCINDYRCIYDHRQKVCDSEDSGMDIDVHICVNRLCICIDIYVFYMYI
jgi:hypothetical protein